MEAQWRENGRENKNGDWLIGRRREGKRARQEVFFSVCVVRQHEGGHARGTSVCIHCIL